MSSHNHNVETDSDILSHAFWSNLYNQGPSCKSQCGCSTRIWHGEAELVRPVLGQHSWHSVTCRHTVTLSQVTVLQVNYCCDSSKATHVPVCQYHHCTAVEENITLVIAYRWSVAGFTARQPGLPSEVTLSFTAPNVHVYILPNPWFPWQWLLCGRPRPSPAQNIGIM